MNILLIQPRLSQMQPWSFSSFLQKAVEKLMSPPLTLEQLYAITPEDYEVTIVDDRIGQKINYNGDYDIVGITASTAYINRAYEIADNFKKNGTKVVLGGYHPSAMPDESRQHADSVVIGEGEYSWPKLLEDVKNDTIKPFYIPDRPVDQNDIPAAKRDLTRGSYFRAPIQATRGCPNRCDFCCIANMKYGAIVRKRPIDHVIEEIKSIPQKYLEFHDPSLTSHPAYAKSLFKEMKGLGKKFTCNGNIGALYKDEELLKLAGEAGCTRWYVGFESISQDNIDDIGKKTNKINQYLPAIKKVHDYGMVISGHFVLGLDNDTTSVFQSTLDTINELELTSPVFHTLTPYPGTPLFDRMDKQGRITSKDWSRYTLNEVNFKPMKMTEQELFNGVTWIKKQFYSFNNLTKITHNMEDMGHSSMLNMILTHTVSKFSYIYAGFN